MFNERFAKIRSQRIKKAVKGIVGGRSSDLTDDLAQEYSGKKLSGKKRTHKIVASDSGGEKSGCRSERSELGAFVSGRARGRNRARGRGSGRSQEKTNFEVNNEVSADDSSDQEEIENHTIPEAVTKLHRVSFYSIITVQFSLLMLQISLIICIHFNFSWTNILESSLDFFYCDDKRTHDVQNV